MEFNRESFEKGKDWFFESKICLYRSFIIQENTYDIHGAIEALQHCFELSCKSLYLMLDLQYPRDHDAAIDLDKVRIKLFQTIPEANQEQWPPLESWIREKSKYMKKTHETSIYGDEKKDILASKLFSKEELGDIIRNVSILWSFVYHTLAVLGIRYNALTPEEHDDYAIFEEFSMNIKKMETYQLVSYFRKIFTPQKLRY